MAGSNDVAISVVKDCLQQVFGEADASKRKEAITRLWVEDEGSVFADPERVWRGHKAIDDCVAELADKFVGWTFVALGIAQIPYMIKASSDGRRSCDRAAGKAG